MHIRNGRVMVPLYAARIEDLGPVDFMVVECHSCNNVGLLSARFLLSLGFPPHTKLKGSAAAHALPPAAACGAGATSRSGGGRASHRLC
jgi:hypothetical protein